MSTLEHLENWKKRGAITAEQFDIISAIVRKQRFSIFIELNVLFYLGVLSFIAGLGWTIQTYFADLGDPVILTGLSSLLAASLYYCFSRGRAYSNEVVDSPNIAFDYVLYLACLVFGSEIGYIESRFHLLNDNRDYYLLISALLYLLFAYRFDNRLVLSLGLSTLAAWFGVKISRFTPMSNESLRVAALGYGAVVAGAGAWLFRQNIKKHFFETFLHVAANVLFIALLSDGLYGTGRWFYFAGLMALAVISIDGGVRFRRFVFVVYGIIYGYAGISAYILRDVHKFTATLTYFVVSSAAVIALVVVLARRFGRDE